MPNRDTHRPGTPSWLDLATTDVEGSKAFYSDIFGWEWEQNETDQPDNHYYMARLKGRDAAGLMQQAQEQVDMGLPCMWNLYMTVADVDAVAAAVADAGGSVMAPPFDVMDAGRMAVLVDPTGAVFSIWQPKDNIGAEIVNEPGAFTWAELTTTDQAGAAEFYEKLFGMTSQTDEMPGLGEMTFLKIDGEDVASAMPPPMEGIPNSWGVYFAVDDTDATCARIEELGGQVLAEPFDIPPGRCAPVTDPSGAAFSIIALAEPPTS